MSIHSLVAFEGVLCVELVRRRDSVGAVLVVNNMRILFVVALSGLLACCTSARTSGESAVEFDGGGATHRVGSFVFETPLDMAPVSTRGVDSATAGFARQGLSMTCAAGPFDGGEYDLADGEQVLERFSWKLECASAVALVLFRSEPTLESTGSRVVVLRAKRGDGDSGLSMTLRCETTGDVETALAIVRTVRVEGCN